MKTEIYTCDKCKAKVLTERDLIFIEIKLKEREWASGYKQKLDVAICAKCAEKFGFVKRVVSGDKIVPEIQDTKAELYNIVVRLIQETGIQVEY